MDDEENAKFEDVVMPLVMEDERWPFAVASLQIQLRSMFAIADEYGVKSMQVFELMGDDSSDDIVILRGTMVRLFREQFKRE